MSRSDGSGAPQIPDARGRPFAKGNPGRPQGSKNRTTLLAAALLEGKCDKLLAAFMHPLTVPRRKSRRSRDPFLSTRDCRRGASSPATSQRVG
jgi:hypothetical protein